jgi:hypothetical protein
MENKTIDTSIIHFNIEAHIQGTSQWIKDLENRRKGIMPDHNNLLPDDMDQMLYLMSRLSFEMKYVYSQLQPIGKK